MNQRLKFQLAGYIDDGMDYSNSIEIRSIVDGSDVAKEFYEALLISHQRLESLFQSKEIHKTNKKLHKFIDDAFEPKNTSWKRFVPLSGLMMATFALFLTLGLFINPVAQAPALTSFKINIPTSIPAPQTIKNYQVRTLWSLADSLTEEMDATIYQVMYGMFTANSTAFMNADIKSIRADVDLVMPDKTLVQMINPITAQQMVESFLN